MVMFHSYVSLPEGNLRVEFWIEDFPHHAGEGLFLYQMCHVSFSAAPTLLPLKANETAGPEHGVGLASLLSL